VWHLMAGLYICGKRGCICCCWAAWLAGLEQWGRAARGVVESAGDDLVIVGDVWSGAFHMEPEASRMDTAAGCTIGASIPVLVWHHLAGGVVDGGHPRFSLLRWRNSFILWKMQLTGCRC